METEAPVIQKKKKKDKRQVKLHCNKKLEYLQHHFKIVVCVV